MILTSKQLEELENAHDSTGALSEEGEDGNKEDVTEAALEWRRQLIEEAAEAIKRAKTRPLDEGMTYEAKSLLFDRETRRFGRVHVSVPGYLKILYLTGGEREWGLFDLDNYLLEAGSERPPAALAAQLAISEEEVLNELDRLDITPVQEEEAPAEGAEATSDQAPADKAAKKAKAEKEAPAKAKGPAAPKQKGASAKASPSKTKASDKPKSPKTAKGADDTNGFIKKNFKKMTNRELAEATGLSEHTIRRKLGEWGLKRKQ